jgi:hypothetical protein
MCVLARWGKGKIPGQDIDLGVEVAGVEPASPKLLVGLLRAQPMVGFGWLLSIGTPQPTNPQLDVLTGPEATPASEPLSMTHRPSEWHARRGRAT